MSEHRGPDTESLPLHIESEYGVTVTLLIVFVFVFMVEVMFSMAGGLTKPALNSNPWDLDAGALARLGALSRRQVLESGEWWRLITAPLMHAGPGHVFFNGVALFFIGPRVEGLVGPTWFFGIFAVSCLVGDLFSLVINAPSVVSVGASGGIMGLFAAAVIFSFRFKISAGLRTGLQLDAMRVLMPTLIPALFIPLSGGAQDGVDVAAHLGGAFGGIGLGWIVTDRSAGRLTEDRVAR